MLPGQHPVAECGVLVKQVVLQSAVNFQQHLGISMASSGCASSSHGVQPKGEVCWHSPAYTPDIFCMGR